MQDLPPVGERGEHLVFSFLSSRAVARAQKRLKEAFEENASNIRGPLQDSIPGGLNYGDAGATPIVAVRFLRLDRPAGCVECISPFGTDVSGAAGWERGRTGRIDAVDRHILRSAERREGHGPSAVAL
jgi:hypothetical protein